MPSIVGPSAELRSALSILQRSVSGAGLHLKAPGQVYISLLRLKGKPRNCAAASAALDPSAIMPNQSVELDSAAPQGAALGPTGEMQSLIAARRAGGHTCSWVEPLGLENQESCILFDLDGTLVDSEPLCNQAFLDLLPDLPLSLPQMMLQFRGRKLAEILSELETLLGAELSAGFENTYRNQVARLFTRALQGFPGVHQALCSLEVPYCIASSGPQAKIRAALTQTGLADLFGDRIFSSYDIGSWKPDPGLFLHAAAALGAAPSDCIVVEDSAVGLAAARAAGMRTLLFDPEIQAPYVSNRFESYDQLGAALDRLHQA